MAHGGKRKGAGRRKGALGKRTEELLDLIDQHAGVSPGRVLLECMWYFFSKGNEIRNDPRLAQTDEGVKKITEWYTVACVAARAAAPYIHPKLAPVYADVDDDEEWRCEESSGNHAADEQFLYTSEQLSKMDNETLIKLHREQIARSH